MTLRYRPARVRYAAHLAVWFALTISAMGISVAVADRAIGLAVYASGLTAEVAEAAQ